MKCFSSLKAVSRCDIIGIQNAALRIAILQPQKSVTPSDAHSLAIQQLAMMRRPINQDLRYRQIADFRSDSPTAKSPSDGVSSSRVYCLEIAASMNEVFLVTKGCRRRDIIWFQNAALRIAVLQAQKSVTPSDAHSLAIKKLAMMRWLINQDLRYRQIADFRCD